MKKIITLTVKMQIECDQESYDRLKANPQDVILDNCFKKSTRKFISADIVDVEHIDTTIDTGKLLENRTKDRSLIRYNTSNPLDANSALPFTI